MERFCGATGRLQAAQKLKHASVYVVNAPDQAPRLVLSLKPTHLVVPLRPPLKLHTACIAKGTLGLSLLAGSPLTKTNPANAITTMQVCAKHVLPHIKYIYPSYTPPGDTARCPSGGTASPPR